MNLLVLQVGKSYLNRRREVVSIVHFEEGCRGCWPFEGDNGEVYQEDGARGLGVPQDGDLIEEYTGTPAKAILDEDATNGVLDEVYAERESQESKWGQQNHRAEDWYVILGEEFGEVARAIYEASAAARKGDIDAVTVHLDNYRDELIQVAAVAVAMAESLDRSRAWLNP